MNSLYSTESLNVLACQDNATISDKIKSRARMESRHNLASIVGGQQGSKAEDSRVRTWSLCLEAATGMSLSLFF